MGYQDAADDSAAIYTGLAGTLIDAVADLEKALAALGIHVIGDGGTAGGDGLGEHFGEGLVEAEGAILAQPGGNRQGVNAGAEEAFIGVDIPHAADEGLIEQEGLDAGAAEAEGAGEIRGGDLERLGAEAGYASGEILVDLDGAELAAVIKLKHAAIEGEDGVGVLAGRAAEQQAAGHAKVQQQVTAAGEGHQNELAVTADGCDAAAGEAGGHALRVAAAENPRAAELGVDDAATLEPQERPHDGFDFGQFGHLWHLDEDPAIVDPHRISGDAAGGIASALAGAAIEFPKVVRAGEVRAIEVPLAERTAVVNADAIESVDDAFDIADGVRVRAYEDFHDFAGRQIRGAGDIDQRHIFQ